MRVGLVIYGSLATLSGGYLYDSYLVDYLRQEGDVVEVVSLPDAGYLGNLLQNLDTTSPADLITRNFDVLLQDELCHPSLIRVNHQIAASRIFPVISIVHHLRTSEPEHSALLRPLYRQVEYAYLNSVDGYILNSATTQSVIEDVAGSQKPWVIARPGADRLNPNLSPDEIYARARASGSLRILFLGNVIPRKGLETLINAVHEIPDADWQLSIVGSLTMNAGYAGRMQKMARDHGHGNQILFMGPLLDDQLATEMARHHLMVLPSHYEGFGIAYYEAMGFGMPVIGSEGGAAREIIQPDLNGYLITPGDSAGLANHLTKLIYDRNLLAEIGIAALKHYQAGPRWQDAVEKIRNFLHDVVYEDRKRECS
jgi:glycosyltransferase involved in cell wall biosynthesis